jgi:hypothetical protein
VPEIKPKFAPGIRKEDSPLAAEGGWTDADKVRFYKENPQTVGGSEELSVTQDPNRSNVFDPEVFDEEVFRAGITITDDMYPGQTRGAHAWNDNSGKAYLAWGTTSGLFVMYDSIVYDITPDAFVPEPSDTSASVYGAGLYGVGIYGSRRPVSWSQDNWGENLLACSRGGTLYEWTPGSEKALSVENAPDQIETFFVSPERIVVLLGTKEFGGVYSPMLVRWCGQGDNTDWTPSAFNIAGEFPLSAGSRLMAGVATRGQNVVWSDDAIYTMQFTGDVNSIFVIRVAGRGCGLIGPHAYTTSDSAAFWVSRNNFYVFTGQVPQVLPSTVRSDVFDNIFPGKEEKVHVGWNTGFQEPWFFYPDARDATGECSRYVMMSPEGHWSVGTWDRTAWVRAGVFPFPIAFSANHKISYHEIPDAGDDGDPLDAFVESGFIDVGDGDTLYIIRRYVPDFLNQQADVSTTLKAKFWPSDTPVDHGPYIATPTTSKLDMRVKAREFAVRHESSGAAGASSWTLGAAAFDAKPSGERR